MVDVRVLSIRYAAPVLVSYVRWILKCSVESGIMRIYFLARDGYTLKLIADEICSRTGFKIDCRYLYCSRKSLRLPSYHLIGDEAYMLLSIGATRRTIRTIFDRAGLDTEQIDIIRSELRFENIDEPLNASNFDKICKEIFINENFQRFFYDNSRNTYKTTIGYLKQEGLMDSIKYAIVDSGWTGSMQRSLRQILENAGYKEKMHGFYFGLFNDPSYCDGEYNTYYFNAYKKKSDKIFFCNNLFECWLSAPHGMTIGYKEEKNEFVPVTLSNDNNLVDELIREQIAGVIDFLSSLSNEQIDIGNFIYKTEYLRTREILRRIMSSPTREEAECLGKFSFCDDITEGYHQMLASPEQAESLKGFSLIKRICRKLVHKNSEYINDNLFWEFGTMAFYPPLKKAWCRANYLAWEWLRFTFR